MIEAIGLKLLVFEPGEDEEAVFTLAGRALTIGRDADCEVLIADPSVSSRHGALRPAGGGYAYTELGSRNGSALLRAGAAAPVALVPGEPTPVAAGDVLLLGDAARPVRLVLRPTVAPYAAPPVGTRTMVATAPLADLLGRIDDEGLVRLAARALSAGDAQALATAALEALSAWTPRASGRGVALWGAGMVVTAGDAVPGGVRAAAVERGEVVLFEEAGAALPTTESLVQAGVRAALAAPLVVGGVVHGVIAAWSTLGAAALPEAAVSRLAVAASLVGLSAAALGRRVEDATRRARLEEENSRLRGAGVAGLRVIELIGQAPVFVAAMKLARSVAGADVAVLLQGETGTGKEVAARNIHLWSRRAAKPFVAFNCAAVPEALIESELFGHLRGAFTGAAVDHKGLFEEADGGTIFLDEIGEMPAVMQAKLLRVLQDGEVRRVGAAKSGRVDVRVLSATHRDLVALVAEGRFRADLMYRLNAVTVRIPALRERGDDVALLAHFLLGRACEQARKRVPGFAADALWALAQHDFPGNVRELENEILRAVALTPEGEPVRAAAFSERVAGRGPGRTVGGGGGGAAGASAGPTTLKDAVEQTERRVVEEALARAGGNVSQSARDLGLTRPGLYKVMERLGLRD